MENRHTYYSFFNFKQFPLSNNPILVWGTLFICVTFSKGETGDSFEKTIRPILAEHCYECHSATQGKSKGGLQLDSVQGIMNGGDSGRIFKSGLSNESIIYQLIAHREPEERMPPDYRLEQELIDKIKFWIDAGGELPEIKKRQDRFLTSSAVGYSKKWEKHWAFQPLSSTSFGSMPGVVNHWIKNPIDIFILKKLDQNGLRPSKQSSWTQLVRRVYLDITGLPPSAQQIKEFLKSPTTESYIQLIDDLLARKEFGEHWARMWLDVARYADSNGSDENLFYANAHRYRNYVIKSFNDDKSYFKFVKEQIAGDLMAINQDGSFDYEALVATGFLNLGPKLVAEQDKEKLRMDLVDEQMDVLGQVFLGISIGCARCHDHKFDPFSQNDYYAMAGIFRSTQSMANYDHVSKWLEKPIEHPQRTRQRKSLLKEKDKLEAQIEKFKNQSHARIRDEIKNLKPNLLALAISGKTPEKASKVESHKLSNWKNIIKNIEAPRNKHWKMLVDKFDVLDTHSLDFSQIKNKSKKLVDEIEDILHTSDSTEYSEDSVTGYSLKSHKGSYIEIPHDKLFEPNELTITSWIKISEFPKQGRDTRRWIVAKTDDEYADGHYALGINKESPIAYINIGGGATNAILIANPEIKIRKNTWTHLAISISNKTAALFVNGKEVVSIALPSPRTFGNGPLVIGKRPDNYNYFNGKIDDVIIFNSSLSPKIISKIFKKDFSIKTNQSVILSEDFNVTDNQFAEAQLRWRIRDEAKNMSGLFAMPDKLSDYYQLDELEPINEIKDRLVWLKSQIKPSPSTAMSVEEGEIKNLKLHVRGNHLKKRGQAIPRRMPMQHMGVVADDIPSDMSGRLELANWLTHRTNPLTPRVIVNRLWAGVFGKGIVSTPNNFGRRGMPPTHPKLLDWLAQELINNEGSIKGILKLMFSSATYMQDSRPKQENMVADPGNQYLWRMSPRRMTAEQIRDSLLKVSGLINFEAKGKPAEIDNYQYVPGSSFFKKIMSSKVRTIYLPVIRDRVNPDIEIFDFANPGTSNGFRGTTTIPLQALFFLNNPEVARWAQSAADQASQTDNPIEYLFEEIIGRSANEDERKLLTAALSDENHGPSKQAKLKEIALSLFAANEFIYRF